MKKKTKTTESVPWYNRFVWREHIKWLSPFSCLYIHIRFRSRHASTMKCNYIKCSTFNTLATHIFRTVEQWHHRISSRSFDSEQKNSFIVTMTFCQQHDLKVFSHHIDWQWNGIIQQIDIMFTYMWWIDCIYLQTTEKNDHEIDIIAEVILISWYRYIMCIIDFNPVPVIYLGCAKRRCFTASYFQAVHIVYLIIVTWRNMILLFQWRVHSSCSCAWHHWNKSTQKSFIRVTIDWNCKAFIRFQCQKQVTFNSINF